ncbi:unnamed protein product [Closterium sp. Naga37s-1]|nr:unnamed protein product [Closterium sp. Naga37s-1]
MEGQPLWMNYTVTTSFDTSTFFSKVPAWNISGASPQQQASSPLPQGKGFVLGDGSPFAYTLVDAGDMVLDVPESEASEGHIAPDLLALARGTVGEGRLGMEVRDTAAAVVHLGGNLGTVVAHLKGHLGTVVEQLEGHLNTAVGHPDTVVEHLKDHLDTVVGHLTDHLGTGVGDPAVVHTAERGEACMAVADTAAAAAAAAAEIVAAAGSVAAAGNPWEEEGRIPGTPPAAVDRPLGEGEDHLGEAYLAQAGRAGEGGGQDRERGQGEGRHEEGIGTVEQQMHHHC